jgi:hypothetical protein
MPDDEFTPPAHVHKMASLELTSVSGLREPESAATAESEQLDVDDDDVDDDDDDDDDDDESPMPSRKGRNDRASSN